MKGKLAVDGGKPAKTTPNIRMTPGGNEIGKEEKEAVMELLDVGYLIRYYGPEDFPSRVNLFEEEFAGKMGVKFALGVNSGTSALITALVAVGVGPGDEVIIPGYTFFATCAVVLAVRAIPVIAEVDTSLTLDPVDFENKITSRTKAVIPVHMRGAPCQIDNIMEIARRHDVKVVEDVAQACGGRFKEKRLGSFGNCNGFSLGYAKIITAGEGGVVTADDPRLYDRAREYHDTAACWRPGGEEKRFSSERYSGELFPGVNFRMPELLGAVSRVQLRRLDDLIERMRNHKARIKEAIGQMKGLEYRRLNDLVGDTGICLMFFVPTADLARRFNRALRAEGIDVGSKHTPFTYNEAVPDWHIYAHWEQITRKDTVTSEGCPYTCSYYKGPEPTYASDACPRTLDLLSRAIHINIPPQLREEDCDMIAEGIVKVAETYL